MFVAIIALGVIAGLVYTVRALFAHMRFRTELKNRARIRALDLAFKALKQDSAGIDNVLMTCKDDLSDEMIEHLEQKKIDIYLEKNE